MPLSGFPRQWSAPVVGRLSFLFLLALSICGVPVSRAGLNAGAVARLYWVTADNQKATYRNETSCKMKFVVTVTGATSLMGASCKILVGGYDSFWRLPPSWQMQPGGCGDSTHVLQISRDSFPVGVLNPWIGNEALLDLHLGMQILGPTVTYDGFSGPGVIWMQTAGLAGVKLAPTSEYGLYSVSVDQSQTRCVGGCTNRFGLYYAQCFQAQFLPDGPGFGPGYAVVDLTDENLNHDLVPLVINGAIDYALLTWNASIETPRECPTDAISVQTWGGLRRIYR
jgi:hypothetical protein